MSQAKKFYRGHISQAIAQDAYCGSPDDEVFFAAPIDLLPDDQVFIDPGSGRPLAVYRDSRKIWEFQGEYVSGSFTFKLDADNEVLAHLLGGGAGGK